MATALPMDIQNFHFGLNPWALSQKKSALTGRFERYLQTHNRIFFKVLGYVLVPPCIEGTEYDFIKSISTKSSSTQKKIKH